MGIPRKHDRNRIRALEQSMVAMVKELQGMFRRIDTELNGHKSDIDELTDEYERLREHTGFRPDVSEGEQPPKDSGEEKG